MEKFSAQITAAGHKSILTVNGRPVPNLRAFSIHSNRSEISKLHVEMALVDPFEVDGQGEIVCRTIVVNREIARQTFENLKKYFKEIST